MANFLQASPKTDHQYALSELHVAFFHGAFAEKPCRTFIAPYDITISRHEDDINMVQPDLMVICDLEEKLGDDGYYHGVPDFVVEILSASTKRNDLLKKFNPYLDGDVKEYWDVDPESKQITIYQFSDRQILKNKTFSSPEKAKSFWFSDLEVDLANVFL